MSNGDVTLHMPLQVSHTYSIFEQADIVAHLAESLSVTKAHLLSHDYGDTVAQELLARYNHAVVSQGKQSQTVPSLSLQSLTMLNGGNMHFMPVWISGCRDVCVVHKCV